MPYHDLNLECSSPQSPAALSQTIALSAELGYQVLALSVSINGKLPANLPTISPPELSPNSGTTILTRLNLTVGDTSQNHRLSHLSSSYSLLALRPTNEKSFQLCCSSLECDIISLDFTQRLPFILKFKTVSSALQRGIRFEICYSPGIVGGTDARRNVISGATALIRATRGRGIILSSEAKNALGLRGPHDIMNLAQIWGLSQERGKEALCEEANRAVQLARLRRDSYRGVIRIVDGGGAVGQKTEKQPGLREKVVEEKKEDHTVKNTQMNGLNPGIKRTASNASLNAQSNGSTAAVEEKPLSKREQKRRANKARIEAQNSAKHKDKAQERKNVGTNNSFPIKHEALLGTSAQSSKKS
jgi:ribonuclease P/MRP protein subunit RPP1